LALPHLHTPSSPAQPSRLRPIGWSLFSGGWALLAAAALACSGSSSSGQRTSFPPYGGESAKLFDDRIDPNSVGLADVASKPRADPVLRARTQSAESVAKVRVSTVTVDSIGGKPAYHINLAVIDPLARRGFDDRSIEISVRPDSPAFGIVKWLDTRLIGRTFIGFFHRFGSSDEVQVRFHLSADEPEVLAAVRDANTLSEVSGK
jgi:hypothetical protein